ncbi:unnamed protein product [Brassica oleracea var. botrytis]
MESFAGEDEIGGLRKRMDELLTQFDPSESSSVFSITNQQHTKDHYFFDSAAKISFFFEALHELDPLYKEFTYSSKVSSLVLSFGYRRPVVMQSMYIFKQPGIGGEVVPHQDNSYVYTDPPSCTGLWMALEDSTTLNSCLWAIPGSHKNGLVRRFVRGENGVTYDQPSPSYEQKDFVPIEMKAGSIIAIHGDLIHQSFENLSPKSRHAYSLHVVESDGCKWAQDNWKTRLSLSIPLNYKPVAFIKFLLNNNKNMANLGPSCVICLSKYNLFLLGFCSSVFRL